MKISRRKPLTARAGLMGVGLDTYWEQFPGLLDELMKKNGLYHKLFRIQQESLGWAV